MRGPRTPLLRRPALWVLGALAAVAPALLPSVARAEGVDPGFPLSIAAYWGGWPAAFASGVDAAVNWGNGKAYFFKGSQYLRYDIARDTVDGGPSAIAGPWRGFPAAFASGVDAAVNWGNGKVYFFKGGQYLRYDIAADATDGGYPLPIGVAWHGLPASFEQGVDAAVAYGNGKVYFFKGAEYVRYDMASDMADAGYPRPIAGNWIGFPAALASGVDDAIDLGTGKVYFFRGASYVRYDKGYLAAATTSDIRHVVVISQENHSFDAYFGRYCQGPAGVSCHLGRGCCERGPDTVPIRPVVGNLVLPAIGQQTPFVLDDSNNAGWNLVDRNHGSSCELLEMNGGAMDVFVQRAALTPGCGSPFNFAYAPAGLMSTYWGWADQFALADRYFQPIAGASGSNDIYFATARWKFWDNIAGPHFEAPCQLDAAQCQQGPTIGTLLAGAGVGWTLYAEGLSSGAYESGDNQFAYFGRPAFRDTSWTYTRDLAQLASDIDAGLLPPVAYIKAQDSHSEHPASSTISAGVSVVETAVSKVLGSGFAASTLILFTFDESGGFFDHVAPPPAPPLSADFALQGGVPVPVPYGPRVPLLAIGPFAKKGFVSHTQLEHSSIVKFIEWNWLGGHSGQLASRDAVVNNLGSLLDGAKTGAVVPAGASP